MTNITTTELVNQLRQGTVEVTFTKQNGDTRVMRASLEDSRVTQEEAANAVRSQTVVSAMDVDLGQWRSIPVNRITQLNA